MSSHTRPYPAVGKSWREKACWCRPRLSASHCSSMSSSCKWSGTSPVSTEKGEGEKESDLSLDSCKIPKALFKFFSQRWNIWRVPPDLRTHIALGESGHDFSQRWKVCSIRLGRRQVFFEQLQLGSKSFGMWSSSSVMFISLSTPLKK